MDNKKWFIIVMIPNLCMALSGIFFAILCYGLLGWTLHWKPTNQPYEIMVLGLIGVIACYIPWIINRQGRVELKKSLTSRAFIKIGIVETVLWIFTLLERINEQRVRHFMDDISFTYYVQQILGALCSLLFMLSCMAGIGVGIITFIIFMFQKEPQQLWDDKAPRKRN